MADRRRVAWPAVLFLAALTAACMRMSAPEAYLQEKSVPKPSSGRVTVCHGYDCTYRSPVVFMAGEWRGVRERFRPAPADAEAERRAIAASVALIEEIVGRRIGTASDKGGLAYIAAGDPTQQDCIDESTNTTAYLMLLEQDGLLRHHRVAEPASRGVFLDFRWYHQTAVIVERGSGREYVVDSWFDDNGAPPVITTLGHWRTSYGRPSGT